MTLALPAMALAQGTPVATGGPIPITFPRDDGPHDSGVEWWYFTGHLFTATGQRYGFEDVIFRARQGNLEGYVSHFAVTDNPRGEFHYDQRIVGARGASGDAAPLDLDLQGWTMRGGGGRFALAADMPGYAIRLDAATTKPATLHDGDGYIDYGNGTSSYYYSWTRLTIVGELSAGQGWQKVTGEAWMDHQWGDFATYRDGGWDWYAVQLEDGTDVMLYLIRGPRGETLLVDGSLVDAQGTVTTLEAGDFTVTAAKQWTSPATGTTYPSNWTVTIPGERLTLTIIPTMPEQELDTRRTTGVVYWEGEATVAAEHDGRNVNGLGYVELTGYAPYVPLDLGGVVATPGA
jgi:predicted secreted hydrolase